MNAAHLLTHFDRLADAPDAIPRLRRFILDLAVRGKLVEQNPNDEPAGELLKRIAAEKKRLVEAGEIKKTKAPPTISEDHVKFEVPKGWSWCCLGSLSKFVTSGSRDWAKYYSQGGAIFIRMGNLSKERYRLRLDQIQHVKPPSDGEGTRTRLEANDLLISITGDVGMLGLIPENFGEAYINQHTAMVRPVEEMKGRYLAELFRSPFAQDQFNAPQRGIKNSFRLTDITQFLVPLPPLAEQHRIVAKVDELMALCDRLETTRKERETTRDRLATASLARLKAPDPDPAVFQNHAAFALNNLTPLTTRPDQIKALRQTILNLAVRGKLVEQDPKEDSSNQGKLRPDTAAEAYDVGAFESRAALFKRPFNWAIEPLSRVASHIVDCLHTTPEWTEEGVLCIKTNQVRAGQLDLSSPHFVSENTYKVRVNRLEPSQDDILYIREGGVLGVACLVPSNTRLCLGQRLMQIRANDAIAPQFLELCLNSPWITEFAAERTTGGAAPRVNMSIVRSYPIPLPPLSEQHRIVAKVNELMTVCDRLEAGLAGGEETRGRLVEAVLREALVPGLHRRYS